LPRKPSQERGKRVARHSVQPDGNEPRKPSESPDSPTPILAPATIVSTPAPRIPRRKRCEENGCEARFIDGHWSKRYCVAHSTNAARVASLRKKRAKGSCAHCRLAPAVATRKNVGYCVGCIEKRTFHLEIATRRRTIEKAVPEGWRDLTDDDLAKLVSLDPTEAMHGENKALDALALAHCANRIDLTYTVLGIDDGIADALDHADMNRLDGEGALASVNADGDRYGRVILSHIDTYFADDESAHVSSDPIEPPRYLDHAELAAIR